MISFTYNNINCACMDANIVSYCSSLCYASLDYVLAVFLIYSIGNWMVCIVSQYEFNCLFVLSCMPVII